MGIVIEDLPGAASAQTDHVIPAMRSGETVKLTAQQLATFIIAIVTDSAPSTLDTLNELAAALGDDPNFATTVTNALATKASLTGAETLTNKTLTAPVVNGAPSGELLRGHFSGLTLSNNGTDATNDIDIASGSAGSDGATPVLIALAVSMTKRTDAAWAAGSGNGGWLDGASMPDGTGHAFLMRRPDTGAVDVGFSASLSPTLPANYTQKVFLGSVIKASGSLLPFLQIGDDVFLRQPLRDVNVTNQGTSAISRPLTVPSGVRVKAKLRVRGAASSAGGLVVFDDGENDTAPSITDAPLADVYWGATASDVMNIERVTSTTAEVRTRSTVTSTTVIIVTRGWRYIR